jgi:hypothetical protein
MKRVMILSAVLGLAMAASAQAEARDPHGWIGTETVKTRFGDPESPSGKEENWVKTVPGKGWFTLLRFYGPKQEFFDQTWRPDDIVAQ